MFTCVTDTCTIVLHTILYTILDNISFTIGFVYSMHVHGTSSSLSSMRKRKSMLRALTSTMKTTSSAVSTHINVVMAHMIDLTYMTCFTVAASFAQTDSYYVKMCVPLFLHFTQSVRFTYVDSL
jgi:hypothetical protein